MRKVYCIKLAKELEGLDAAPFPGAMGQMVFDHVSKQAWQQWLDLQTRLINEKQLQMFNQQHRDYLHAQMDLFLHNKQHDSAVGYIAPE